MVIQEQKETVICTAGYFRSFFNNKPAFHNLSIIYRIDPLLHNFRWCSNDSMQYIIGRLWKAGLLLKNQRENIAVYTFSHISDCQWIPWEGRSIPCSREDFHFFSTPDYIICFTFRPTNVSVATSNRNSSPNQNDLNRSGDQQESHDQSDRSHGLTGMKGLSVIFYLDDYGFYTTDLPALHYKSSMAKGKIDTLNLEKLPICYRDLLGCIRIAIRI